MAEAESDAKCAAALTALALAAAERPPAAVAAVLDLRDDQCRWPIGEPSDSGFRFCDRRREPGRPYCRSHLRRAAALGSGRKATSKGPASPG